jgi:hypothetical protein
MTISKLILIILHTDCEARTNSVNWPHVVHDGEIGPTFIMFSDEALRTTGTGLQEVHEMPSHNMKAIFYFVRLQIHKDT